MASETDNNLLKARWEKNGEHTVRELSEANYDKKKKKKIEISPLYKPTKGLDFRGQVLTTFYCHSVFNPASTHRY